MPSIIKTVIDRISIFVALLLLTILPMQAQDYFYRVPLIIDPSRYVLNPIIFDEVEGAVGDTLVFSNEVTLSGSMGIFEATVSGQGSPTFSVNGGAFATRHPVTIGDTIRLRLTSSPGTDGGTHSANFEILDQSAIFSVTTRDTTPDTFSFASLSNQTPSTFVQSGEVTISGITDPTLAAVSGQGGPEISISGGPWTTSGSISNGQSIEVRLLSSAASGGTHAATVDIGGVTAIFNVANGSTIPGAFSFDAVTNAPGGEVVASNSVVMAELTLPAPVSVGGDGSPQISIGGEPWTSSGTIENGQTLQVRLTAPGGSSGGTHVATVDVGSRIADFSVSTIDTTPDGYAWTPQTNVAGGTIITSNPVIINGITAPTAVSVTGPGSPHISISGSAWATSGTISNGQTLSVRLTSVAGTDGGTNVATTTVGGVSASFSVTTADTTPNAYGWSSQSGVARSALRTSNLLTIGGITAPTSVSVSGQGSPQISIAGGAFATSGTIANGQSLQVRLTASGNYSTTHTATTNVGGVQANFSVTTEAAPALVWTNIGQNCCDGAGCSEMFPGVPFCTGTFQTTGGICSPAGNRGLGALVTAMFDEYGVNQIYQHLICQ